MDGMSCQTENREAESAARSSFLWNAGSPALVVFERRWAGNHGDAFKTSLCRTVVVLSQTDFDRRS
jgi:hypothetical protein